MKREYNVCAIEILKFKYESGITSRKSGWSTRRGREIKTKRSVYLYPSFGRRSRNFEDVRAPHSIIFLVVTISTVVPH